MLSRSRVCLVAVVAAVLVGCACASKGDQDEQFRSCLARCTAVPVISRPALSLDLQLTRWTWDDNCKYTCMHSRVQADLADGKPVQQYYGKWPFVRFLGMQEPASVLFSVINLLMYIIYAPRYFRDVAEKNDHMNNIVFAYTLVGINTWVWSTVFHTRDLLWTERLDYFSATLLTVMGTYLATVRVFNIRDRPMRVLIAVLYLILYLCHIGYLSLVTFDYGWNMTVNIAIGAIHGLLWIGWWAIKRQPHGMYIALLVILFSMGMSLEILDFAPLFWTIDAHSLWHAWTIMLVPIWFKFLREDHNSRHLLLKSE